MVMSKQDVDSEVAANMSLHSEEGQQSWNVGLHMCSILSMVHTG